MIFSLIFQHFLYINFDLSLKTDFLSIFFRFYSTTTTTKTVWYTRHVQISHKYFYMRYAGGVFTHMHTVINNAKHATKQYAFKWKQSTAA